MSAVLSDLAIAQKAVLQPIRFIAEKLGVPAEELELYGNFKAKLPLTLLDDAKARRAKLILVTSMNPTPSGEGKTMISVGLADGFNQMGKKATVVLREPSLGPVFGVKGGAAGGGYAQVMPMEDINLHFTGDFSSIEKANNLLSALIDNNLQSKKYSLGLDPRSIVWKRVMDMNDRALRHIVIGLGGSGNGIPREEGFNITAASEVMAILCLSKDLANLKERLGNILVGFTFDKKPVFARELKAAGPMAVLLKEAIKPNLVQTLEGTPAILHGGPFANIAQGTNSIIATRMGLALSDYVVTEAGFGADLGAEKFMNIKCGYGGLEPHAIVVVATIKALRHHGGAKKDDFEYPSCKQVEKGFANLEKHIENCTKFGITPVVAINRFLKDTPEEIETVVTRCKELGVTAVISDAWAEGGKGSVQLAEATLASIAGGRNKFKPLYDWNSSLEKKIETIASEIYGADGVDYSVQAKTQLKLMHELGFDKLPVCMAKTQKSLSDKEGLLGRPRAFRITVREFEYAAGAGFVVPILGEMMRMPGLPPIPAAEHMDIDKEGRVVGLS